MYDPNQHFVDLQENSSFGDTKSWLLDDDDKNNNSSPTLRLTHSNSASTAGTTGNIDPVLFNNIVEMVPLIESLIHRKGNSSFTRRGSMIYTKTPSRDSLYKKMTDPKGRNASQSIPTKKKKEHGDKDRGKSGGNNQDSDNFSIFSSRSLASEKDIEELVTLREQVEDLQRKLAEKDELLKSAEISKNQMNDVHGKLDELKHQAAEKDSLIKSIQLQLSDAKIKLADRQAALEKIRWEAMTSNTKVEKLQEELDSKQGDISSMMLLFEGLTNESTKIAEDYDVNPRYLDYLPDIDDMDDIEMQEMEEARQAYIAAVATAKEKQDEESIAAAASARLHLQSFVLRSNGRNAGNVYLNGGVSPSYRAYVH
ncbi:protein MICROTUBULE BINDING PROTEIN 2C [Ricinus communis]|uniref:protein MICROTUBULE BINDING PROTEIN 2C n=1 Tax=Ricinus communis TaxID=3988 RepID=UPI00201ABE3E|nr:protein MICROTUBULE BINDING PROTEIN 2C [Ricinus communis]